MSENFVDHIGDDGNFGSGFKDAAIGHLGKDFAETKVLDDVTSVAGLVKHFAHTKRDHGRLGKQLENSIQRPGDKATDTDKLKFKQGLLKELGSSTDPAAFTIYGDEWPEELGKNEEYEKHLRDTFVKHGIPVDSANGIVADNNRYYIASLEKGAKDQAKKWDDSWDALGVDWPGEQKAANIRLAVQAMLALDTNKDRTDLLRPKSETNKNGLDLFNDPTNAEKWRKMGIAMSAIKQWHHIATKTSAGTMVSGAGGTGGAKSAEVEACNAINKNSPELQM